MKNIRLSELPHESVSSELRGHVANPRVSGTFLLIGEDALPYAYAFARALLCESPIDGDACGTCSTCRKTNKILHPDLVWIVPSGKVQATKEEKEMKGLEGRALVMNKWVTAFRKNPFIRYEDWASELKVKNINLPVADLRYAIEQIQTRQYEAQRKVVIIWGADMMGTGGNIMLKTLEEPPANRFIILVARNKSSILPTIRSRSIIITLPPLSENQLITFLSSQMRVSTEEVVTVAEWGRGSVSLTLSLIKENSRLAKGRATELWNIIHQKGPEWQTWINSSTDKVDSISTTKEIVKWILSIVDPQFAHLGHKHIQVLSQPPALKEIMTLVEDALYSLNRNVNPKLTLHYLLNRLHEVYKKYVDN
ncbi:MAG: hypothetical protein GXO48_02650 [Chlorobi bacterium]|nr:hypothetical protein [Chlorobiota bacterium]